ncbi:stage III sporulation protein AG [Bacillus timonensis]|nr:stage III sporulation protein AG [Bacillus timonensis]
MNRDNRFFQRVKEIFFQSKDNSYHPEKKPSKFHYIALVLGFGILIMLVSNMLPDLNGSEAITEVIKSENEDEAVFGQKKNIEAMAISEYEDRYENQLKEALETIVGVGDVTVVVNVNATETKVLEKNTVTQSQRTEEEDREGGKRSVEDLSKDEQVVFIRTGEQEAPIIIKIEKPEIRGVLVVAKGADNIQIKKMVVEAVTRLLDVPSHRVSVLPKKS